MSDFLVGLLGASYGRSAAKGRRKSEPQKTVDPFVRFGRAVWRRRLPLGVMAGVWALAVRRWWDGQFPGRLWRGLRDPAVPQVLPVGWWHRTALLAVAMAAAAVLTVLACSWPVPAGSRWGRFVRRERAWSQARLVEDRWEQSMLALGLVSRRPLGRWGVPQLCAVKMTGWGGFKGRLRMPRGFDQSPFDDPEVVRQICLDMELAGNLGVCEEIAFTAVRTNSAKWRDVVLVYRGLQDPRSLPPDIAPAEDGSTLRIGVTASGHVGWNLDQQPFLKVQGSSGKGKGLLASWLICQAVRAGWMVIIIDGVGAPEHEPWAALPNVLYFPLDMDDPERALAEFNGQLGLVRRLAARRQRLCRERGRRDWKSLDRADRMDNPRVLVVFDEFAALVGKAAEDEASKRLRQELGDRINKMLRQYRKYGFGGVIVDQISYANTYVGPDGLAQATQFVFCGAANPTQQRMVSAGSKWPQVPNRPGYGTAGVVGEPSCDAIVWPDMSGEIGRVIAEERDRWRLVTG